MSVGEVWDHHPFQDECSRVRATFAAAAPAIVVNDPARKNSTVGPDPLPANDEPDVVRSVQAKVVADTSRDLEAYPAIAAANLATPSSVMSPEVAETATTFLFSHEPATIPYRWVNAAEK